MLQLRDGVLEITQTCTEGDTVESAVLEGFSASLTELFQEEPSPAVHAEIVWVNPPTAASRQLAELVPLPALKSAADIPELWTPQWDSLMRGTQARLRRGSRCGKPDGAAGLRSRPMLKDGSYLPFIHWVSAGLKPE